MNEALNKAADLCRQFEGFFSKPYLCPAGIPTIGYGTVWYPDGRQVTLNDEPITKAQADELLLYNLSRFLVETIKLCPVLAAESPGRLAAILDFTYNLGPGRLKVSTLRKKVNSREWSDVKDELMKWTRGGGKILPGLVRRRQAECALINKEL